MSNPQNPQQGPPSLNPAPNTTPRNGSPTTTPRNSANPTTTPRNNAQPTTTARSPNANAPTPPSDAPARPDVDSFPTLPNIAPIPPVHFPPNEMPHLPPVNTPQQPQPPTSWHPREGHPDPRCPQFSDPRNPVHLPHNTNCGSFYKCDHGLAFEYNCPPGQHWNSFRNYCDFPSNANCQLGSPVPRPQPLPQQPLPPTNNWNQPRNNPNPGYEHPIVIPMAPRT